MNEADDEATDREIDREIDMIRERITDSVMRSLRMQLIAIGRDWQRCGKAACARTRRCRGVACER